MHRSNYVFNPLMQHIDFVFYDAPYNELKEAWEYQITVEILRHKFKQVNAVNYSKEVIMAIMHKPRDCDIVMTAMEEEGYCQMAHFYWYKGKDHQTKTPVSSYTNSVEMGTIGFRPDRSKCKWQMGKDPRFRQNHFECKGVTKYYKDNNGDIINPCQKPPALMRWLCGNHLPAGSNVLILGAGSGADIIGAVQACCNVVAVERDDHQYKCMKTTLVKYSTLAESSAKGVSRDSKNEAEESNPLNTSTSTQGEDDNDDEGPKTVCPECGGDFPQEDIDTRRVCGQCITPAPLHPNCAHDMQDGTWLCITCYEENWDRAAAESEDEPVQKTQ